MYGMRTLPSSFRVSSPARCNWPGLKQRVVIFFIFIKVAGKKEFLLRHIFLDFFEVDIRSGMSLLWQNEKPLLQYKKKGFILSDLLITWL
jgi:hypothetical protein